MQITSVSKILLSHTDVQKACAEFIEKNGVTGAATQFEKIALTAFKDTIQAKAEIESTTPSLQTTSEELSTPSAKQQSTDTVESASDSTPPVSTEVHKNSLETGDSGMSEKITGDMLTSVIESEEESQKQKDNSKNSSLGNTASHQNQTVSDDKSFDADKMKSSPLFIT